MAGTTVVDQLIVKLGLDPSGFTKGQKETAASILTTEKTVKSSAASMGSALVGLAGKALGVATVAIAIKKAANAILDFSTDIRQLGIDSRNFGVAASEIKNFQNISETFGGKADDVTKTIGNITKAVYDLAYNGQISDSLIMLGRLGVQFQDTAGNARDFKDIVLDTQTAIQTAMKNGTSRANAAQILSQAGFDPGLTQAILSGTVGQQLAKQQGRRQVTEKNLQSAETAEQARANASQAAGALALRPFDVEAAGITKTNNALAAASDYANSADPVSVAKDAGHALAEGGRAIEHGVSSLVNSIEQASENARVQSFGRGRAAYEGTIQAAAKANGIDPEILAGVLKTESNFNPGAHNPSGATGVAQLLPKYFPGAGRNPHDDIYTAAAYLRKLHDSNLASGDAVDEDGAWNLALQDYNAGQTRVRQAAAGGKPLAQETVDYPGKVLAYANSAVPTPNAGTAGNTTNSTKTEVNIGTIEINTQATDAEGIAGNVSGAINRKMNAAQADTGMQ